MLLIIRLLTWLAPIIAAAPYWFVFDSLSIMIGLQLFSLIIIFIIYWLFAKQSNNKINWPSLSTIVVYLISIYFLSFLMERRLFLYVLAALTLIVVLAWLELDFKKSLELDKVGLDERRGLLDYLIYCLFFTCLFGWREFLVTPIWLLTGMAFIYTFLISKQCQLINQNEPILIWKQRLIFAIAQAELFFTALVLPLPYYTKGALLALLYYLITILFIKFEEQKFRFKYLLPPLSIFLFLLVLLLFTSKW